MVSIDTLSTAEDSSDGATQTVTGKRRKRPFTVAQQKLVALGLEKGLTDCAIARRIEGISQAMVFNFRNSKGISAADVLNNRHNTWIRMLEAGVAIEVVGGLYGVKPMSIKQALWHYRKYSFREAKAKLVQLHASQVDAAVKLKASAPFSW